MRGEDPAEARKVAREARSVAALAADYLERHAIPKKRPKSVRDDRAMLLIVYLAPTVCLRHASCSPSSGRAY
jgi:hypothetical protein